MAGYYLGGVDDIGRLVLSGAIRARLVSITCFPPTTSLALVTAHPSPNKARGATGAIAAIAKELHDSS